MPRGRPKLERQREIAELRAKGLTYREIGERFGVSLQAIYESLQCSGNTGAVMIRCRKRLATTNNRSVYCMNCLPPTAAFTDRPKARRLAAGMTQLQLLS